MLYENVLDMVGNTPLVRLANISQNKDVKIYAKLEGQNPTGSIKDRIVKYMISEAENSGKIKPGMTLLEPTSGNTGISLAMVAKLKGYNLKAVMPDSVSRERRELLKAYGAEVILSEGRLGTNGAIRMAQKLAAKNAEYVMLDQYSNPANVKAHYDTTGREILQDLRGNGSDSPCVDVFVAGLGTGGTLMGAGKRLREHNPAVKIIAVQPFPKGGLQGLRSLSDGFVPPILDLDQIDESIIVGDVDAFTMLRTLLEKEAILAGISSGAVMQIALKLANDMDKGTIVTVFPDGAWKYLSLNLWTEEPKKVSRAVNGPLW